MNSYFLVYSLGLIPNRKLCLSDKKPFSLYINTVQDDLIDNSGLTSTRRPFS